MIKYDVFSPSGNITALVSEPIKESKHPSIATQILAVDPYIEQVGFISPAHDASNDFRLDMMGGEFCVNGARSAALFWFQSHDVGTCTFEISGLPGTLTAHREEDEIALELPFSVITARREITEGWIVDMESIRFILTEDAKLMESVEKIEKILDTYEDASFPALGFALVEKDAEKLKVTPWVRVKATQSLKEESACGSGSIAACVAFNEPGLRHVLQPSGETLTISFVEEPAFSIHIAGGVTHLREEALLMDSELLLTHHLPDLSRNVLG